MTDTPSFQYHKSLIARMTLCILLLGVCGCAQKPAAVEKSTPMNQPNILFLLADDWSYPHAGVYGDPAVRTPTFDFLATGGILFRNAYCASPSCSPSRAAILTSQYPHQLESAGNLWSVFPSKFPNWVSILEAEGYFTGSMDKGWGPGDFKRGGYQHNPAGRNYKDFAAFLNARPQDQPFCFWFGSTDPHRDYEANAGVRSGMSEDLVEVPGFMPEAACVKNDIMDYYYEVERFDRRSGNILRQLEQAGELENTLVIMTSDNGMPFPRAKANLYDYGTRMPLVIYWPEGIRTAKEVKEFTNSIDLGPTILEAAGVEIPEEMWGKSLMARLQGKVDDADRSHVFLERERHANVRQGDLSYPMRAVRNENFLYIRNLMPERHPAGDPTVHQSVGQYGDVDNSITKFLIMAMEGQQSHPDYFTLSFGKRPAEELYKVDEDPYQLNNLAGKDGYSQVQKELQKRLQQWMEASGDLRATQPETIYWDTVEYTPDYQFENFDLKRELASYHRLEPRAYSRFDTMTCQFNDPSVSDTKPK